MKSFEGVDYFDTDSLLSEEELLIRNSVREFVSNEVIPIIEKHNREATFPIQLVPKMAELGLLGFSVLMILVFQSLKKAYINLKQYVRKTIRRYYL